MSLAGLSIPGLEPKRTRPKAKHFRKLTHSDAHKHEGLARLPFDCDLVAQLKTAIGKPYTSYTSAEVEELCEFPRQADT